MRSSPFRGTLPFGFVVGLVAFVWLAATSFRATAAPPCTMVTRADTGAPIVQVGPCDLRNSPASTFKLALALVGYDAGILTAEHAPAWPYDPAYRASNKSWQATTDPTSWLANSVVWYSQVLVRHLGESRLQAYVDRFDYGNRDLSGYVDRHPLPTPVWVDSTLKISPSEQVQFLRKMILGQLPVSRHARDLTMAITPAFTLPNGWVVHGKTGTGYQGVSNPKDVKGPQFGWFVGWLEEGGQTFVFARLIRDEVNIDSPAGPRARDSLLADLPALLAARKP